MVDSFSHASDEPVPLIDPPQQGAVVNDIPHPVVYLLESDVLVMESIAEEGLLCDPSERSGEARSAHLLTWRSSTRCVRQWRASRAPCSWRSAARMPAAWKLETSASQARGSSRENEGFECDREPSRRGCALRRVSLGLMGCARSTETGLVNNSIGR